MRRLRQDHRHRRGSGHTRQEQDNIRRSHSLLARRHDEVVEGAACGQRLQVQLPDTRAVPQPHARTETAVVARQRIFPRSGRVLRVYRQRAPQDPVPRDEGSLYGQDDMSRVRRVAPAQRGTLRQGRRPQHRRAGTHDGRRTDNILRHAATRQTRQRDGKTHTDRDTQPSGIPVGRRVGVSDARPSLLDAIRRREPAHKPRHVARQQPRRVAIYTRRTEYRPAPA